MPSDRENEIQSFWYGLRRVGLPDKAPCTGSGPGEENPLLGAILSFLLFYYLAQRTTYFTV